MDSSDASAIRHGIIEKYRRVADSPTGLFRYPIGEASALSLGYPPALLARVPSTIRDRFVGVGNPFALGEVRIGESVLDLGCGAGFDAFVAAQFVGAGGAVVGVDLSAEMLAVANAGRAEIGWAQLDFREAAIEALPFPEASFDAALSNGVLNLIPNKPAALREIFRVLRSGGHLQACDIGLTDEETPPDKAPWSD